MKRTARAPAELLSDALVIKLGGSLGETGELRSWCAVVARAKRPLVVVPGGGPFADAVREAQEDHGLDDRTAHRMAILAMHQTGLILTALEPRLVAVETVVQIKSALTSGRVPVWLPLRMADRDRVIPTDWSITSDGLAARLAERIGAAAVCLVKSCRVDRSNEASLLARHGVVDPEFARIVARTNLRWRIFGPGEERQLASALRLPTRTATSRLPIRRLPTGRRRGRGPLARDSQLGR